MTNPAIIWSNAALEANRLDFSHAGAEHGGPTQSSRALALAHLAMHDAYFSVLGTRPTWYPNLTAPSDVTDANAALAAAAEAMLRALFHHPSQISVLDKTSQDYMNANPLPPNAVVWGREVARCILDDRQGDMALSGGTRSFDPRPYHHRADPYHPDQGVHGPDWGQARPFTVPRVTLAPPPGWSSAGFVPGQYYKDEYQDVLTKGALSGHSRSADQTVQGTFWAYDGVDQIGTPPRLYLRIAHTVLARIEEQNPGQVETAHAVRVLAMMATAMADAGIQAWHWKYQYDFWRPVVGIREADASLGPAAPNSGVVVEAHPDWKPLGAPNTNKSDRFTPPFPAYPSGHATFGAAAFQVLRRFLEDEGLAPKCNADEVDAIPFDFVSDEMNGKNVDPDGGVRPRHLRHFANLWQATVENSLSRVYLGVHWRFDGISTKDASGQATHGIPAKPGELGPVGGVWLGREIGNALVASGLLRHAD